MCTRLDTLPNLHMLIAYVSEKRGARQIRRHVFMKDSSIGFAPELGAILFRLD